MARNKYNKAEEEDKPYKFENTCYRTCCHNKDKKRILWKQGRHKSNKCVRYK